MDRRHYLGAAVVLVAVAAVFAFVAFPAASDPLGPGEEYPAGAGADHIDFETLGETGGNVSHAPREHWESYVVDYAEPPDRRLVEGVYYVDGRTGATLADRWHDAEVYRNGSVYAVRQPADGIPDERTREALENDPEFRYDDATDAYYRYDPRYGRLAPTNLGRHTAVLEPYTWEAVETTDHHGVDVITYRVTGRRADASNAPPATAGTLRLGADDGVVYAFDITLEDGGSYRYTYEVRPAPFPDHDWVETAREVSADSEG